MQVITYEQYREAVTLASWTALKVLGIAVLVFFAWLAVVLAISIPLWVFVAYVVGYITLMALSGVSFLLSGCAIFFLVIKNPNALSKFRM